MLFTSDASIDVDKNFYVYMYTIYAVHSVRSLVRSRMNVSERASEWACAATTTLSIYLWYKYMWIAPFDAARTVVVVLVYFRVRLFGMKWAKDNQMEFIKWANSHRSYLISFLNGLFALNTHTHTQTHPNIDAHFVDMRNFGIVFYSIHMSLSVRDVKIAGM